MRLLFINRFFYPDQAATSQILTDLTEGLVEEGRDVTVLTGRMWYLGGESVLPSEDCYEGVGIRRVWSTRFGRRSDIGRLIDYATFYLSVAWSSVRSKGIDSVVVLSDPPMLSVLAVLLGWLKGWKTVCWLQDVFPEIAVQAGALRNGKRARVLKWLAHWSFRHCDLVIVLGRCMEQQLLGTGVARNQLLLIPNWADGDCLAPVDSRDNWFRKQQGLEDRIVVMYSGNLGVVHEMDSVAQIIRQLQMMPNVCFLFVGDGSGKVRLEELVRREGLNNVRFVGYQEKEDLPYSLSAGDIHLVTLRSDMAGLSVPSKVYGIMAVGRPVVFIGPEESEVAILIRESLCGEVFDPVNHEKAGRAILDLAQDPRRREYLGAEGRRYFEMVLDKKFAIPRFQAALYDLLKER